MIYLLDTNVLSAFRRPERAPHVVRWLADKPDDSLFLSVVTLGEIVLVRSGRWSAFSSCAAIASAR